MAKKKESGNYQPWSKEGLAKTGAVLGFIMWIVGLVWHGGFGQPSMMMVMYGMPYLTPMISGGLLIAMVVGGFVLGWLAAAVYNWTIKK